MRIIAGAAKGRRLRVPRAGTRPPTGRLRAAVFSSLGSRVRGAAVLDLYAGSGAFGLEALSRGAATATFVERGRAAARVLEENVGHVGLGGTVVREDVATFLARDRGTYDLVFVDPPYALALASVETVLAAVAARLRPGGSVLLHRRSGEHEPAVDGLRIAMRRRYGGAEVWRFVETSEEEDE